MTLQIRYLPLLRVDIAVRNGGLGSFALEKRSRALGDRPRQYLSHQARGCARLDLKLISGVVMFRSMYELMMMS